MVESLDFQPRLQLGHHQLSKSGTSPKIGGRADQMLVGEQVESVGEHISQNFRRSCHKLVLKAIPWGLILSLDHLVWSCLNVEKPKRKNLVRLYQCNADNCSYLRPLYNKGLREGTVGGQREVNLILSPKMTCQWIGSNDRNKSKEVITSTSTQAQNVFSMYLERPPFCNDK